MTRSNEQGSPEVALGVTHALRLGLPGIDVVACDDALIAVDKPPGLPSVPGRKPELADCAWARVRHRFDDARIVHRLDMATSGLLLFARGADVQRTLSRAFAAREVRKTYIARVHGHVAGDEGTIDLPLAADWPNRPRQVVDHVRGKPSTTRWRVVARGVGAPAADAHAAAFTLVELEPLTGRTHQLRVHLASLGHAIVGDTLYGLPTSPPDVAAVPIEPTPRMLLHARSIELVHPTTGQRWTLATKDPPWMTAAAHHAVTTCSLPTTKATSST